MGTALMAPRKNTNSSPAGEAVAKAILENYQPRTAEDVQDAIKDAFGPLLQAMLQGEMDNHLGFQSNDHGFKDTDNRRNGYIDKTVRSSYGDIKIKSPRDRDGSFEPQVVPKRSKDIISIENQILSMYANHHVFDIICMFRPTCRTSSQGGTRLQEMPCDIPTRREGALHIYTRRIRRCPN